MSFPPWLYLTLRSSHDLSFCSPSFSCATFQNSQGSSDLQLSKIHYHTNHCSKSSISLVSSLNFSAICWWKPPPSSPSSPSPHTFFSSPSFSSPHTFFSSPFSSPPFHLILLLLLSFFSFSSSSFSSPSPFSSTPPFHLILLLLVLLLLLLLTSPPWSSSSSSTAFTTAIVAMILRLHLTSHYPDVWNIPDNPTVFDLYKITPNKCTCRLSDVVHI